MQKEYVKHKTNLAWSSLIFGVVYVMYHVFEWYTERGIEASSLREYRHLAVGFVIILVALVSMQRTKAAARRYEEFV